MDEMPRGSQCVRIFAFSHQFDVAKIGRWTRFTILIVLMTSATLSAQRAGVPTSRVKPKTIELKGVPDWLKERDFEQNGFTFVRIRYGSDQPRSMWATDFPDADLNLAAQIGQLTKLDVSKPFRVLTLTDPNLKQYPFVYLAEPGGLRLTGDEVSSLRNYLVDGGFLVMDDFWGDSEWQHVRSVMKEVFPDRDAIDLPLSHVLFHCVFDLSEKPQVVNINEYLNEQRAEPVDRPPVNYRGIVNDKGRVMVLMCHNTDLADGWERVGIHEGYTREMSQRRAYPMGVNIVFYALTQSNVD